MRRQSCGQGVPDRVPRRLSSVRHPITGRQPAAAPAGAPRKTSAHRAGTRADSRRRTEPPCPHHLGPAPGTNETSAQPPPHQAARGRQAPNRASVGPGTTPVRRPAEKRPRGPPPRVAQERGHEGRRTELPTTGHSVRRPRNSLRRGTRTLPRARDGLCRTGIPDPVRHQVQNAPTTRPTGWCGSVNAWPGDQDPGQAPPTAPPARTAGGDGRRRRNRMSPRVAPRRRPPRRSTDVQP